MRRFPKNGGIVMARQPKQEKQPHLAWRITRTVLDVLGKIILVLLIAVGTVALIAAIAGSIFLSKFKSYVELDIIPKAEEYAEGLELDNISLAQTSIIYYTDPKTGEYRELQQLYGTENRIWVSYDDIPLDLVHAAISIEDKRFPTHKGVAAAHRSAARLSHSSSSRTCHRRMRSRSTARYRRSSAPWRSKSAIRSPRSWSGISTRSTSVRAATVSRVRRASTLARRSPT